MIVTTGRIIKIAVGDFRFERSSETPGAVVVSCRSTHVLLPTNTDDMEAFITAYRRMCVEDIGYRESKVE